MADTPINKNMKEKLKSLYKNGSGNGSDPNELIEDLPCDGLYGIIDPRYVGYNYVSYMFIEAKDKLTTGKAANRSDFDDEEKALMKSAILGEYDFVHRRADTAQYRHAHFTVNAKENDDLSFFQEIETYPVFSVGRWHGQDVNGQMTDINGPPSLSPIEGQILLDKMNQPNISDEELLNKIQKHASSDEYTYFSEEHLNKISDGPGPRKDDIRSIVDKIKSEKNILIGESIQVDATSLSGIEEVIVGISVTERENNEDNEDDHLPNEKIMNELMQKYDGWKLPYVMSGVGQNWADIILEMRIESVQEMNSIADSIRKVDGVKTTRTLIKGSQSFEGPLVFENINQIETVNRDDLPSIN